MFDYIVKRQDKAALHYGDRTVSYDQMLRLASLYGNYFLEVCGERPERVMYTSKNTPDYVCAIFGAMRIGATAIPVDATATAKEFTYMVNDSRPQIIYTALESREMVCECVAEVATQDASYKPHIFSPEDLDYSAAESLPVEDIMPHEADDTMVIIYTSGTTGSPKGVELTYANLWYNVDAVCNFAKIFKADTRLMMILPLHHIFAFAGAFMAPLYAGGEIYILESLAPDVILKTFQEGHITLLIGVPRLYETLAKGIMAKINANPVARVLYGLCAMVGSQALSRKLFSAVHKNFGGAVDYLVSGGAALPIETGNIFKNLGFYILEGYGMTECAPMISFTRPGERKVGYCGRMLPGCEYKIEESGELCVRGANVMKGYYKREAETAAVIRDGWLHTGDTALYDDRYGIQITGRIKEIIVTPNGKNINPASIENEITQSSTAIKEIAILLHDDILQALVYPDLAAIQADTQRTMDDMIRAEIEAYNQTASSYKRIMRYQIISQELPKTRLGKTQRFKLAELISNREEAPREDISDRSETFRHIKSFLDEQTGIYANGDSHFEIDLALDSLGRVSLLAFVEDSFGVSITESQLSEMSTLNQLSAYVEERSESMTLAQGDVSWDEILKSSDSEVKLPKSGLLHWLVTSIMWITFKLLYRFRSSGEENIPSGGVLFVANHRSGFDGVFVTTPLSWAEVRNTYFFAKDKHFQGGFKRFMASKNNVILMNIHTNVRVSMQQMYQVLSQGHSIVIFPEGTRSKGVEMGEFKESFAILSKALNVPVVPVAISGSEGATYDSIRIPRFCKSIEVEYLHSILPHAEESASEFAERVKSVIGVALK